MKNSSQMSDGGNFEKTRNDPLYKWALENMTIEEAEHFSKGGWSNQDDHSIWVAALDILAERKRKMKRNFLGRWYLSDEDQPSRDMLTNKGEDK